MKNMPKRPKLNEKHVKEKAVIHRKGKKLVKKLRKDTDKVEAVIGILNEE